MCFYMVRVCPRCGFKIHYQLKYTCSSYSFGSSNPTCNDHHEDFKLNDTLCRGCTNPSSSSHQTLFDPKSLELGPDKLHLPSLEANTGMHWDMKEQRLVENEKKQEQDGKK